MNYWVLLRINVSKTSFIAILKAYCESEAGVTNSMNSGRRDPGTKPGLVAPQAANINHSTIAAVKFRIV